MFSRYFFPGNLNFTIHANNINTILKNHRFIGFICDTISMVRKLYQPDRISQE